MVLIIILNISSLEVSSTLAFVVLGIGVGCWRVGDCWCVGKEIVLTYLVKKDTGKRQHWCVRIFLSVGKDGEDAPNEKGKRN